MYNRYFWEYDFHNLLLNGPENIFIYVFNDITWITMYYFVDIVSIHYVLYIYV